MSGGNVKDAICEDRASPCETGLAFAGDEHGVWSCEGGLHGEVTR